MNIAQALKKKNQLATKLKMILNRAVHSNRTKSDIDPSYDSKKLLKEEYTVILSELIAIKVKISAATRPMFEKILIMGEMKSLITHLRGMSVSRVDSHNYANVTPAYYNVTITEIERDKMIEEAERAIVDIQNELDVFNAKTEIE